jgi:ABC-type amino acid transport substrate-binding protein
LKGYHLSGLILSACLLLDTSAAWAKPEIRIGGYEFPPYVSTNEAQQAQGLTLDLIQVLNQSQQLVTFKFVSTSISNRHQAFELGRYDAIMFESLQWGWQEYKVDFIPVGVQDGELYISLREGKRDQSYFNQFRGKKLALVNGYHYQFVQWNNDPEQISQSFDAMFVPSNKAAIEGVLKSRADIAPVTWSYLQFYLSEHPLVQQRLLLSDKWDQRYHHGIILNPKAQVSAEQLTLWLNELKADGTLEALALRYQLALK